MEESRPRIITLQRDSQDGGSSLFGMLGMLPGVTQDATNYYYIVEIWGRHLDLSVIGRIKVILV